jgi:hypothetical protein
MSVYLILAGVVVMMILLGIVIIIVVKTNRETDPVEHNDQTPSRGYGMGSGMAVGMAIGLAIGVALDNIAIGVAIGAGIGVAMGAGWEKRGGETSTTPTQSPRWILAMFIGVALLLMGGVVFFMLVK